MILAYLSPRLSSLYNLVEVCMYTPEEGAWMAYLGLLPSFRPRLEATVDLYGQICITYGRLGLAAVHAACRERRFWRKKLLIDRRRMILMNWLGIRYSSNEASTFEMPEPSPKTPLIQRPFFVTARLEHLCSFSSHQSYISSYTLHLHLRDVG